MLKQYKSIKIKVHNKNGNNSVVCIFVLMRITLSNKQLWRIQDIEIYIVSNNHFKRKRRWKKEQDNGVAIRQRVYLKPESNDKLHFLTSSSEKMEPLCIISIGLNQLRNTGQKSTAQPAHHVVAGCAVAKDIIAK